MKSSEKIIVIHDFISKICKSIGLYKSDKIPPQLFVSMLLATTFFIMYLNGCYQSYNDPYKLIHALIPSAIIIIVVTRLINLFYYDWVKYDPLMLKITLEFYQKYEQDPKYNKILAKRVDDIKFYTNLFFFCSFSLFLTPIAISLVLFVFSGEKLLFINNYLPWTDPNETFGFLLNLGLLSLLMPVACVATSASDGLLILFTYQTVPFCDIICCHLTELAADLEQLKIEIEDEAESDQWIFGKQILAQRVYDKKLEKLEERFIDIIKEHHEYDQYIKHNIHFNMFSNFFAITCNSFSIGLSIVSFFKISMSIGVNGALLFGSQVVSLCIIGTMVSTQNNRIAHQLLDFPWHKMSRSKQKVFLQFIHLVQHTTEYVIPIFGYIIDLEAFTGVINMSYSYFTFFWKMSN